jgi:hypothetical protein
MNVPRAKLQAIDARGIPVDITGDEVDGAELSERARKIGSGDRNVIER